MPALEQPTPGKMVFGGAPARAEKASGSLADDAGNAISPVSVVCGAASFAAASLGSSSRRNPEIQRRAVIWKTFPIDTHTIARGLVGLFGAIAFPAIKRFAWVPPAFATRHLLVRNVKVTIC